MARRSRRAEFSVTEPITLDDLRWLVNQCTSLPGTASVDTKEHKGSNQFDYDQASITVSGEMPDEDPR